MAPLVSHMHRTRKSFSKIKRVTDIPNLIEIQKRSYDTFLQADVPEHERKDVGLQAVFKSVFPIKDFNETASLEFVSYKLDAPKYDVDECHERGMTFAAPLRVVVRLVVWDTSDTAGPQSIRDVKEQEVYFGEIPLMTDAGTFIINGTERVVVSQLHRSPGVFFDSDKAKAGKGAIPYTARVLPYRGSWLDFEIDHRDMVYVRIDRRRKMPATVLLRALGFNEEQLLNYFYKAEEIKIGAKGVLSKEVVPELLSGQRVCKDIKHPKTGTVIVKKGRKLSTIAVRKIVEAKLKDIPVVLEDIIGRVAAKDIVDPKTGEVVLEVGKEFTEEVFEELKTRGIKSFPLLFIDGISVSAALKNTLAGDKVANANEALLEIYSRLRPGDPPTLETATAFFENLFFNPERYDLSMVGRLKVNHKFDLETDLTIRTLQPEDILSTVRYLIELRNGRGEIDDIDHLGNRRVRAVGELVEIQYRIGLLRMERAIRERMSLQEVETLMPHELINSKPVLAVIKEFFGSSQLSQFMDQTNPLSSVTHKRRLSALGPGGLTRERAGFEVRDVHSTHYARICPIETPEGPNIGLIASLSTFARVNEFGFVETPYRKVEKGRATEETVFCSALEEEKHIIAQANAPLDPKGKFVNEFVSARKGGDFVQAKPDEITLMDVSPNQLVSVATSLIPFLENDDANRALMGSNMQRQAVPLLITEAPLVGTGIEPIVARDSGSSLAAADEGIVDSVDASRVVIKGDPSDPERSGSVDIYNLVKYQRSNQGTCINQKPVVRRGDRVSQGDVIVDGPSTDRGELALGRNVIVAFMPWNGYNFEDSILLSERLVTEDVFTSIHIESFEIVARDTKLGQEEITRDIPNVGEEALGNLDEAGIIRIGAEVAPGDILVGKVTPKGETQLSPEEKLLRAIFGDKAGDVKDTSLRVPPGVNGIVLDAKFFQREGVEKDSRTKEIEEVETRRLLQDQEDQIKIIKESSYDRIQSLLVGRTSSVKLEDEQGETILSKGKKIDESVLAKVPRYRWKEISVTKGEEVETEIQLILENLKEQINFVKTVFNEKIDRLKAADELPPGVIKMVKVYVAIKRKIQVGDKMAGRHGNKGVVSKITPVEDMPYLEDGTPVDVVLNPLGVPSRMNVGQILETHLGWAARGLGQKLDQHLRENYAPDKLRKFLKKVYTMKETEGLIDAMSEEEVTNVCRRLAKEGVHMATSVFDGAHDGDIKELLDMAGYSQDGQSVLFNGKTGEQFENKVTVGVMYMLKLHHLVDDKIHARSIGPYSLVTQQPLGGKAQFGGQRLGEMEVWALEAYGAAYALQEFLTVKSDDIGGRTRMYEGIVKGENSLEVGIPESFNVLLKELQALSLDVELLEAENQEPAEITSADQIQAL